MNKFTSSRIKIEPSIFYCLGRRVFVFLLSVFLFIFSSYFKPVFAIDLVPTCSSSSCSVGSVFSSGNFQSWYDWKAFDDSNLENDYGWISDINNPVNGQFVGFHFNNPQIVTSYSITTSNGANPGTPAYFKLQGSNDNVSWVDLDNQNNNPFGTDTLNTKLTFTISNSTSYSYYRVLFQANIGGYGYVAIGELELNGVSITPTPTITITPTPTISITPTPIPNNGLYLHETCINSSRYSVDSVDGWKLDENLLNYNSSTPAYNDNGITTIINSKYFNKIPYGSKIIRQRLQGFYKGYNEIYQNLALSVTSFNFSPASFIPPIPESVTYFNVNQPNVIELTSFSSENDLSFYPTNEVLDNLNNNGAILYFQSSNSNENSKGYFTGVSSCIYYQDTNSINSISSIPPQNKSSIIIKNFDVPNKCATTDIPCNLKNFITNSFRIQNPSIIQNAFGDLIINNTDNENSLRSIILLPLDTIENLTSLTCNPLDLKLPFLNDQHIYLPCPRSLMTTVAPSLLVTYDIIVNGIFTYWVAVKTFTLIKKAKDFGEDRIEVADI